MIQFDNAVDRFKKVILEETQTAGITCWLAGGSLCDYFMGIPVKNDYDLFFPNQEEFDKAKTYLLNLQGTILWESNNGCKIKYKDRAFDLVKKFFQTPEDTIAAFDFTASMIAVDFTHVCYGETTFIDIAKRQLMVNKITYPASSLSRAFKYVRKGFFICNGEIKKIYDAIQNSPKDTQITTDQTTQPQGQEELSGGNFFIGMD